MTVKFKTYARLFLMYVAGLTIVAATAAPLRSQQAAASRFLGTIGGINGTTITVKTDAGEVHQVDVPADASIRRIEPGQKDLSKADTIQFSDLATGDRVLVKLDPDATGATPQALQVIAIKQADVAAKQQKDREDWQRRGVGGLVKSVDAASGVITLTTGAGATAKTVTVKTTKATVLKRYASASVKFDDAKPAPIDSIQVGDQLRARGTKNADGTEIAADEVVSGSFKNVSGLIVSLDASASTLAVKDLATKKQITIHVGADAQMRRLPDTMARFVAARLKGDAPSFPGAGNVGGARPANSSGTTPADNQAHGGGQGASGGRQGGGGGDMQQLFNRLPAIKLADLQKGEAVMIVSSEGDTDVTAITLLAGVEPLLEAPAARDLLSNWSMGGGGADAGAAQ